MKSAVIVLGHGSKAADALETLTKYGNMIRNEGGFDILEIASLQFNQPDLPTSIRRVIELGAKRIIIAPLFLYNGVHIQEDIPEVVAEEQAVHPDVEILLADSLGLDPRIANIVLERIKEVS